MTELQSEGKIRFIGLSEVSVEQLEQARTITEIVVGPEPLQPGRPQRRRRARGLRARRARLHPLVPARDREPGRPGGPLDEAAERHGYAPAQLALAWLLHRSPVMLPIPGTSSVEHLEENLAAAAIELTEEEVRQLEHAAD